MNLSKFIKKNRIRIRYCHTELNPYMRGSEEMVNYKVRMCYQNRHMDFYFSMGKGYNRPPNTADILYSLVSDAYSVIDGKFSDWCESLGYDPDSRQDYRCYRITRMLVDRLNFLLGNDLFNQLLKVDVEN